MDFLVKLDSLIGEHGLNKKKLAEQSGIPYTTIVNWYKRGYENMSVSNFKALCCYFGVTMDSMARDDVDVVEYYNPDKKDIHITKDEEFLISCYRTSDTLDRELAFRALKSDEKRDAENMA